MEVLIALATFYVTISIVFYALMLTALVMILLRLYRMQC